MRIGLNLRRAVSSRWIQLQLEYYACVTKELLAAGIIRDVPDFPKPGIIFKDITPVLEHPKAFKEVIDLLTEDAKARQAEAIVGIESRGFIFGVPIAMNLGVPFVMARKLGKLPYDRISEEYALEYGTNTVEMHVDSIHAGQKAYIVDDLLATGGTAAAAARLVERLKGEVCGFGCLIELTFLNGRENLLSYNIRSLIEY
ncbi:MAG: adenine phosphoribosyltransferase [Fimbriimonadaceae bacterium]|nr:adenine phosphoribosyltransferase [Fimbriimonadaceae bacterium]